MSPPLSPNLDNYRFLARSALWERQPFLCPERWLGNFLVHERPLARQLLDSFVFIPEAGTRKLLRIAFSQLSSHLVDDTKGSYSYAVDACRQAILRSIITSPTGEEPNPSDSGPFFARMTRQEIQVPENIIQDNVGALKAILSGETNCVIFVDDFVGSGNQFFDTITREYQYGDRKVSFRSLKEQNPDLKLIYIPLVSTQYGFNRLEVDLPFVIHLPVHLLDSSYSALSENSCVWSNRPDLIEIQEFIANASARAGIKEDEIYGFHSLALTFAFQHSVPDATIPLFYHESDKWKPLKLRS